MKKDLRNFLIILISFLVLIGLIIGVLFATGVLNKVFQSQVQGFVQWTSRPTCGTSYCDFAKDNLIYSPIVQIDTGKNIFKFESEVKNIIEKKECSPIPNLCSGNSRYLNVLPTYLDSNNCQHYSYDSTTLTTFKDSSGNCVSTSNPRGFRYYLASGVCNYGASITGTGNEPCYSKTEHFSDYGGLKTITADSNGNIFRGCFETIKVYKNNNLIDTFTSEKSNNYKKSVTYFDDGEICDGLCLGSKSGVSISSNDANYFYNNNCYAFQNAYDYFVSNDSFLIDVTTPEAYYIQGKDINLEVSITNNLYSISSANLIMNYKVPTIIGESTKTIEKNVTLNLGLNKFTYTIPTNKATEVLQVQPILEIYYPTNKLSGLNYNFPELNILKNVPINSYSRLKLGEVQGEWKNIMIVPQPIYINQTIDCNSVSCPTNYNCQKSSGLCIRTDIVDNNVTCMQIGCPIIEGHNYYCTSSGICAETIFINKKCKNDTDCHASTLCDVNSGLCIEEHLYKEIIQCNSDLDCVKPCSGITSTCINDRCSYVGECEKVDYGCIQAGCPEGYNCKDNVCIKPFPTYLIWIIVSLLVIILIIVLIVMTFKYLLN